MDGQIIILDSATPIGSGSVGARDNYQLLNNGTILNFSVDATAGGEIWFEFRGQTGSNSDNATINGLSITASGSPPQPSPAPKVTSITKSGTTVTVEFEGTDGTTYDLNKSTDLDFSVPDIKDTVTLSGTTTGTLEDTTATESAAFYRVEEQ